MEAKEDGVVVPLLGDGRRLRIMDKLSYGLGHIHNDLCAALWFTYSLVYFQLVAQTGPLVSGLLIFIGQGMDAIATPLAGFLVDRTWYSRKTWHLIGSIVSALSFPMMFTLCMMCGNESWHKGVFYSVFISLFQWGWALVQISHLSILPEMAQSSRDRSQLTAYRYSATMIANIAVYLIALAYFYYAKSGGQTLVGPADSWTFQELSLTVNGIGILTTLMFQLSSRRKWDVRVKAPEERAVPLRTVLIRMCSSSEIYAVAGVYTTSRLFLTVSMEYLPLYISQVVISNTEALATVPLILFVSSALSSLFHDRFHSCVGQKWTYAAGCLASVTGCALIYFNTERSDNPKNVFIAAAIFGCGNALTMVVSLSLAANLIGSQVECGAFVYSSVTFADKLINGIAVILVQYMRCTNEEDCPNFYRDVLAFLNTSTVLIGFLFFLAVPSRLFRTSVQ